MFAYSKGNKFLFPWVEDCQDFWVTCYTYIIYICFVITIFQTGFVLLSVACDFESYLALGIAGLSSSDWYGKTSLLSWGPFMLSRRSSNQPYNNTRPQILTFS